MDLHAEYHKDTKASSYIHGHKTKISRTSMGTTSYFYGVDTRTFVGLHPVILVLSWVIVLIRTFMGLYITIRTFVGRGGLTRTFMGSTIQFVHSWANNFNSYIYGRKQST